MLPSRIKNCSFDCLIILEETIAAWLLPSPGRKAKIGETMVVAIAGRIKCVLLICGREIFCEGIFVFLEIENKRVEEPNKPVSRGRREFFRGKLSVDIPRKPASKKIIVAQSLEDFSLNINKMDIQIKNQAIILWMNG